MVFIYNFCNFLIQPSVEPREHYIGEVRQKSSSYTEFHKR